MIKQGAVQEALADINAPLPPLNNLPQWSRVNTLDKARYPKPFLKDRLQPLPNPQEARRRASMDSEDGELDTTEPQMNPMQRIAHLEKSIHFLRTQHHEVLTSLHGEIDKVKRENKDLQFKIVVIQKSALQQNAGGSPQLPPSAKGSVRGSAKSRHSAAKKREERRQEPEAVKIEKELSSLSLKSKQQLEDSNYLLLEQQSELQSQVSDEKIEELKVIFLEEEIKDLKRSLREEKNRNHYLTQLLEQVEKQKVQRQQENIQEDRQEEVKRQATVVAEDKEDEPSSEGSTDTTPRTAPRPNSQHLPYNATLSPLQVHLPSQVARPPTLQECEVIMKHMQATSDRQAHELNRLKSDLRDVLYSHKWTPDAYLLAKAYIAEDDAKEAAEQKQLPKIQLKHPSRKLPDIAYIPKDAVSLPAMKATMGNKAMERRKRTQIMQKARMRREVLQ